MNIFFCMNLAYVPITHVKRNTKLSLPFRRLIRSIFDYKVGICPFNVTLISAMLLTRCYFIVPQRKVFNQRNGLDDRSGEHDVTGITARICTTLEHSGNVSNKSFSCITLNISETVIICGLIRAQDEISSTFSSQLPESRRRFRKIWHRRRSFLY